MIKIEKSLIQEVIQQTPRNLDWRTKSREDGQAENSIPPKLRLRCVCVWGGGGGVYINIFRVLKLNVGWEVPSKMSFELKEIVIKLKSHQIWLFQLWVCISLFYFCRSRNNLSSIRASSAEPSGRKYKTWDTSIHHYGLTLSSPVVALPVWW